MTIGQAMRKCREKKGYSRQRLANKSNVPYSNIVAWERDVCVPNVLSLIELADALDVSIDELVGQKMKGREEK